MIDRRKVEKGYPYSIKEISVLWKIEIFIVRFLKDVIVTIMVEYDVQPRKKGGCSYPSQFSFYMC